MASLNRVVIMGRLGQDPDLRYTQNQKAVCTLSVATEERKGQEKVVSWHRVVLWDRQAENASKYLAKGREVLVEGRLDYRTWQDKNGDKRTTTEIIAHSVQFIGGGQNQERRQERGPSIVDSSGLDDIPF